MGEPLLRGLNDSNFKAHTQEFVAQRAQYFLDACPDGSHPLVWKQLHDQYREMFEQHLERILSALAMTQAELRDLCGWLQAHADIFEEDPDGLYPFLEAVTASEDYEV